MTEADKILPRPSREAVLWRVCRFLPLVVPPLLVIVWLGVIGAFGAGARIPVLSLVGLIPGYVVAIPIYCAGRGPRRDEPVLAVAISLLIFGPWAIEAGGVIGFDICQIRLWWFFIAAIVFGISCIAVIRRYRFEVWLDQMIIFFLSHLLVFTLILVAIRIFSWC